MNFIQPPRIIFWRIILFVTAGLPIFAIWQLFGLAAELNVALLSSKSWLGLLTALALVGSGMLILLGLTISRLRDRILARFEMPKELGWLAGVFLPVSLVGYTLFFAVPASRDLLGQLGWVRSFVFWLFTLSGMYALKAVKKDFSWLAALALVPLFQALVHLLVSQFSGIAAYPFSMGWSETSRYYYPALFMSEEIFGLRLPWPVLHPSLHLLLVPPYLFDLPLWAHRLWQLSLRLGLLGLTAATLLGRMKLQGRALRWAVWAWMLLVLFQGPVYFHLTIPLILVLWGFSVQDDRRTWLVLILASMWSGLSRINWYPVPGILVGLLYILEVPKSDKSACQYLIKPLLWFVVGAGIALLMQRVYIALSGTPDVRFFYTSLTSNLLWYRLFPNASYAVGVLPAVLLASIPMWVVILLVYRKHPADMHPLRWMLVLCALAVLFAGGLVVSMKIGGGVDIHNLDAYLSVLLVVTAYLYFARHQPEKGGATAVAPPWWSLLLLVAVPAWFACQGGVSFKTYDADRTQSVLAQIQAQVDYVNSMGGEILFVTQRHLISMGMLEGASMVPEYEREELMEMAMGDNQDYLKTFRQDMDNQRFSLIVVDPLNFRLLGKNYAFGEENNAWAKRVMKPILCNYQQDEIYPEDQIAIYLPQGDNRVCP